MNKGPNYRKWRNYRDDLISEEKMPNIAHPLMAGFTELNNHLENFDILTLNIDKLITLSDNENLPPVERNKYKQKVSDLVKLIKIINERITLLEQS